MDTYADDLAELIEKLALEGAVLVGHSTGGGEVARYVGRHGTRRVAKVVLIGCDHPAHAADAGEPGGLPRSTFDAIRKGVLDDRSQFFRDLSIPFYGFDRPGAKVSQGLRDSFWMQGMQTGLPAAYQCIAAFSETDLTEDLLKIDVPTLVLHGGDDQIVPVHASALVSARLIPDASLRIHPGLPHGMCSTHKDQINADLSCSSWGP